MTTPGDPTILDVLDSGATDIETLAARLSASTDTFDEEVETAQLVREIVQNHVAAEQYLHPLIRRHIADGDQVAHQQFERHRALEKTLRKLEGVDPDSTAFAATLAQIAELWSANKNYLDKDVYPTLRTECDPAELRRLADDALGAEQSGPTRPRTLAVEQPTANTLLSLTQGFVDKTIDSFGHRGHEGTDEITARVEAGRYDDPE